MQIGLPWSDIARYSTHPLSFPLFSGFHLTLLDGIIYISSKRRNKIYLLPLGISDSTSHLKKSQGKSKAQTKGFDLVERACPSVESIGQFVECYFGMKVKLMDPLKFVKEKGKNI